MYESVHKLLMLRRTPRQKRALLKPLIPLDETLEDILRLSQYFNWSVTKSNKSIAGLKVVYNDSIYPNDVASILNSVLVGERPDVMTSTATKTFVISLLSPTAMGLSALSITTLLENTTGSVNRAKIRFGIEEDLGTIKKCPICSRAMKSVKDSGGCAACENTIKSFLDYRRESFVIPINSWNFDNLRSIDRYIPFEMTYLDYCVFKSDDKLYTEHIPYEGEDRIQLILPFKEFQKSIVF